MMAHYNGRLSTEEAVDRENCLMDDARKDERERVIKALEALKVEKPRSKEEYVEWLDSLIDGSNDEDNIAELKRFERMPEDIYYKYHYDNHAATINETLDKAIEILRNTK